MSDDSVPAIHKEIESGVSEQLKHESPIRCGESGIESKSVRIEEDALFDAKASSEDEEADETSNLDDWIDESYLKELQEKLTQHEIELKRNEALDLKARGNEEYKKHNYLDSAVIYTEALRTCPPKYSNERSILYANRAASKMNIGNKKYAIQDCTKSLELNRNYVKAYLRRAKLYEELDELDESLKDFKKVLDIDPTCLQAQTACVRLEQKLHEKNEKLKEEMLGKLKDLGNLVLRPFGLSTDNFKLAQNSETGGYSINFNQSREEHTTNYEG